MKQDIERTQAFIDQVSDELSFPVVAYIETSEKDVLSAAFLLSPSRQLFINKGVLSKDDAEEFTTKKSEIMRQTPGSQSTLTMFVVSPATTQDIERIRLKALAYQDRPFGKTTEKTKS
jgi:hypothetical protein